MPNVDQVFLDLANGPVIVPDYLDCSIGSEMVVITEANDARHTSLVSQVNYEKEREMPGVSRAEAVYGRRSLISCTGADRPERCAGSWRGD
jgi:hypothetical protein